MADAIRAAAQKLRGRHESTIKGKVIEISRDYDDKTKARVEIELPAVPRKRRRSSSLASEPPDLIKPRTHQVVPMEFAKTLRIGDPMEVTTSVAANAVIEAGED